ncbi:MBOAT family protein [Phenylobacterium sp.]|uniref:MBOAT family O-acyltransferase n=1 Tax=Phenylobacterium sp. TaxID=1871053 RepID=UPI002718D642|nr:MBOAT family protein [Phenylobacterium sp.]MDO8379065.1 MBOAT family protein [Phenylobacterium sp.]
MVFSSIIFIFYFLPVFLLGYYVSGWRTGALLAGSVAFYVWGEGPYVFLLLALIGANHVGARAMDRAQAPARRRLILTALIVLDLGVLAWFKYSGFLAHSLNEVLPGSPLPELTHRLPLGISFFTFQLISYAVDVWRRAVPAETSLARFSAYILMFPHLIAGPIVRYADIAEELHADRRGSGRVGLGFQYFIVGLCQKVLIANTVAPVADHAFGLAPGTLSATAAWLGTLAYTLQIYFDFCGYSNMAIGLAFMLGFTFPKNFDHPYAATSLTDFWRRWHMSLSSWFRDYVYIPLGGNRGGQAKTLRNLLIVFFLTGLWHGAAWSFIVWGLYHGAFLMLERFGFGRVLAAAPRPLRHLYAVAVVMVGWVFFRAADLPQALAYLSAMFDPHGFKPLGVALRHLLDTEVIAAFAAGVLFAVPTLQALMGRLKARRSDAPSPRLPAHLDTRSAHILPTPILAAGFVVSIAVLVNSTLNPFLYFRF